MKVQKKIKDYFKNKSIVLIGAAGFIGSSLAIYLSKINRKKLILVDNNEKNIFYLKKKLTGANINFYLGDIKDKNFLEKIFEDADIVINLAANKYIELCEISPEETINNNVFGLMNVISVAKSKKVKKILFTSSDKAANPTNVLGTSKLMGEKLITAANNIYSARFAQKKLPIFSSVRFGNVINSNGSVVEVFKYQIDNNLDLTLTDPEMTRFFMNVDECISIILIATYYSNGGEVFVPKMNSIKIKDLAEIFVSLSKKKIKIKIIGKFKGEKMYEELITEDEFSRTLENKDYFKIQSIFNNNSSNIKNLDFNNLKLYNSKTVINLNKKQIIAFLKKSKIAI